MLKIVIVDDDFTARSNFKTMIDWEKYGFVLCGEANNGQNAIAVIEASTPDIVITDMFMPLMDGVALISYLSVHYPDIKSIALSGYEDFDYVKESLKNGAVDYLLKHKLDSVTLLKVLRIASEKINREHKVMKQLVQSREILRQDFIKRLVVGSMYDRQLISKTVKELELPIDVSHLLLVVVAIDDLQFLKKRFTQEEMSRFISSVKDVMEDILQDMGNGIMSFIDEGKFVIIFHFGTIRSELYIDNHVATTVKRIRDSFKRYLNITACFSLSRLFHNIRDISKLYKEINETLSEKIIAGQDQIFRESSHLGSGIDFFNLDVKDEKLIMMAIKAGNTKSVTHYLTVVFDKIITLKVSYKAIQMICIELIGIANRIARESSIDVKEIYSNKDIPYDEMKKQETIMDVKKWIGGVYERLINLLLSADDSESYTESTRKAIQYIRRNYTQDVSLYQAAQEIGVNSSYLSRTFKEDCGTGFTEYLNNIRVTQAKYLMERTDIKLKEIVKMAGFNNYTYFFKVFKVMTGRTPVEYKAICKSTTLEEV
ncbi:response regulator [Pelosinus sp. UFO1]|uniref:response regulator transcription factor n=1 Tax=Pelosinus sp. UFO1 TaxID=484770 RepID=UPI0004D10943|nr:response regulator [Pelosinus sp. UFO1]AIF50490.1 two component transcriptional regulator, AraC family [Pelosinus sp. UFO1]